MEFRGLPGKVTYYDSPDGNLMYSYYEYVIEVSGIGANIHLKYKHAGVVPEGIISQGKDTIDAYVKRVVDEEIAKQKQKRLKEVEYEKNVNYPIQNHSFGTPLKGRISSIYGSVMVVVLESPCKGTRHISYGYAAAMSGHFITKNGKFTDDALKTAQRLLVEIYLKESLKAKSQNHDVLNDLNKG